MSPGNSGTVKIVDLIDGYGAENTKAMLEAEFQDEVADMREHAEALLKQHARPSRPPYKFQMFDEIDPAPRKDWLVAKMFGAGDLSIMYGDPGSGKSALATDLAFHVACGADWLGRATSPGAVIYVAAERAKLTERRLAALRVRHEMATPRLAVVSGRFDFFAGQDDVERLIATVHAVAAKTGERVVLIVVDTIARVIPGADENHSKDIGLFITNLDLLREKTGAHVMAIHHAGKDKSRGMRGSTALLGAADTTFFVEKLEAGRCATVDKSNDEGEGDRVAFDMESVDLFVDPQTAETTTAPVIVAADMPAPAKNPGPKLTSAERIALDALHSTIDDHGKPRPENVPNIPLSVTKVVDEQFWREAVNRKLGEPGELPDTARKRFRRSRDRLAALHKIGKSGEWIWATCL